MIFLTKTLVFNSYFQSKNLIKTHSTFIFICSVFLLSLVFGAFSISVCENESMYGLKSYITEYLSFLNNSVYLELFINCFIMFSLLILINYILGLCIVGNFISVLILFIYSFSIGSVSGYLYRIYSLNGICFFSLAVFPGLFLFCINYLLSIKRSFDFSKELLKLTKEKSEVSVNFKAYSIKFLIHIILCIFICLIGAFFLVTFSSLLKI